MTNFHIQPVQSGKRRRYDPAFKAMIIKRCQQPEGSVASVAQEFALNANLIHKWMWRARQKGEITTYPGFLLVPIETVKPEDVESTPKARTASTTTIEISSKFGIVTLRCSGEHSVYRLKSSSHDPYRSDLARD